MKKQFPSKYILAIFIIKRYEIVQTNTGTGNILKFKAFHNLEQIVFKISVVYRYQ
jgi:predicted CoA-binding protein